MTTETTLKPTKYSAPARPMTLAEVAAAVKPPVSLRLAESTFNEVQAERERVRADLREAINQPDGPSAGRPARDPKIIRELTARLHGPTADGSPSLDEQADIARAQRREAREAHAAAIQAALRPARIAAGERLWRALDEIEAARATLIEVDRLVLQAGGRDDTLERLYSTSLPVLAVLAGQAQRS